MTYDALMMLLHASDSREAWVRIDGPTIFATLRADLDVSVRLLPGDEEFHEAWARSFPDSSATKARAELYYGASLVKAYYLVHVDGGRALLPMPTHGTTQVSREHYAIAHALNIPHDLDEYLRRAGFTVA